ncbi:hypothetical protein ACHAXR_007836 [Thalassiosira sp. AJA248-18]
MSMPASLFIFSLVFLVTSPVLADLRLDGGTNFGWEADKWRLQVDGVMGGQSSGSLDFDDSNTIMSFSGNVILDGGGFSSVRKERFNAIDLTPYAGIVIQMETTEPFYSDGDDGIQPPLGLHLQFHDTSSYYGYASAFTIPLSSVAGEETSVYLPLSSFDRGSRMGFQCNSCKIDFSSVNEMDIYVLFQARRFNVRVKSITAVDTTMRFPSPVISIASKNDVQSLIDNTIQSGVKLYNYGYAELCIAVYRSTLNTILAADFDNGSDVSRLLRGMICQGFQRAETQSNSKPDVAWTLRYTLNGILEELGFLDSSQGTGWRPNVSMADSLADQCSGVTSGAFTSNTNEPTTALSTSSPTSGDPTFAPTTTVRSTPTHTPTAIIKTSTLPTTPPPTLTPTAIIKTTTLPTTSPPTLTPTTVMKTTSLPTEPAVPEDLNNIPDKMPSPLTDSSLINKEGSQETIDATVSENILAENSSTSLHFGSYLVVFANLSLAVVLHLCSYCR